MGVGSCDFNPFLWVQALTREYPKVRLIEAGFASKYTYMHISADVTTHELLLRSRRYEERKESFDMGRW